MKLTIELTGLIALMAIMVTTIEAGDLRADLREFLALIPRRRMGFIAARRYIVDAQFRSALDYLRGTDFQREWRQISRTPEFMEVLDYVKQYSGTEADVVVGVIDKIPNRLRDLQIPRRLPDNDDDDDDEMLHLLEQRNLSTFLREVVYALPRSQIANLMSRKVREGGDFAQLYRALRASRFRQMVDTARRSSGLTRHIEELQRHYISVDDIINTGFEVLRWGP